MDCPDELDLGPHENYQVARGQITVTNAGGEPLTIEGVRTSCSCTGLELQGADGQLARVTVTHIPPGGSSLFTVRQSITGVVGEPLTNAIYFKTNDPDRPEKKLTVRVPRITGGLETSPRQVVFGSVRAGRPATTAVDVIDRSLSPRRVTRVTSRLPGKVSARLLPPTPGPPRAAPGGGAVVGQFEVTLLATAEGDVDGEVAVEVETQDRLTPQVVSVSGRVCPPAELAPNPVVLPPSQGSLAAGTTVCRVTGVDRATVEIVRCPPGVDVEVPKEVTGGRQALIRVSSAVKVPAGAPSARDVVVLRFKAGAETHEVELAVVRMPEAKQ